MIRRYPRNVYLLCVAVVGAAALVILIGFGQGSLPPIGGDAHEFGLLAFNLLHHGAFSEVAGAPFVGSLQKMPGYPAVLVLLRLVSSSALLVRIVQFGLLAAAACLLYRLAAEFLEEASARTAAVLCASYLPFLWLADAQLVEIPYTFCLLVVLTLIATTMSSSGFSLRRWVTIGAACAAATYLRADFAPVPLILALGALLTRGEPFSSVRRWLPSLSMLAVFVALMAPWAIRNAAVTGGEFVPLTAASGISLYASAEQYAGVISYKMIPRDYGRLYGQAARITGRYGTRGLSPRAQVAANAALTRRARSIFGGVSKGNVIKTLPRRIAYLWATSDYVPARHSWSTVLHRLAQVQYGLLVALGLAGAAIRRRRLLREWLLWIVPVYVTLLHLVFHVVDRYSVPVRATLLVYPAVGLTTIVARLRQASDGRAVPADGRHS